MSNKVVAAVFFFLGITYNLFPGYNGIFFDPSEVSEGEAYIASTILFVGAAIVWFQR